MISDLCKPENSTLKSTSISFSELLNKKLNQKLGTALKSSSEKNVLDEIINNEPLIQLYYYVGNLEDSTSIKGIVVLPSSLSKDTIMDWTLVRNDGTISTIRGDIEPAENYLVVSVNERSAYVDTNNGMSNTKSSSINLSTPDYSVGKPMSITKAKFTSLSAKRTVEPWGYGEPEVRLNVIYGVKNHSTGAYDARNTTYLYPEKWVKSDFWSKWVVWNTAKVTLPHWYFNEQTFERRIIFTEEDGKTTEKEVNTEFTDPKTGIKTTTKIKIPASTDEKTFVDTYVDYYNPPAGELTVGILTFVLAY